MALYKFRVEKELRATQQLLQTALACIGSALIFIDAAGEVTNLNQDAEALIGGEAGLPAEAGVGNPWWQALRLELDSSTARTITRALKEQQVSRLAPFIVNRPESTMLLADGIVGPMDSGGVLILRELAQINDGIEVLPSTQEILATLGPDSLAPNESALCQMLISPDGPESRIARVMDQLAGCLSSSLRSTDVLSVFSASLVSISMPYTAIEEARQIAATLRQELRNQRFGEQTLTVSIGLAHSTAGDQQPIELFRRAAEALDGARESGGDTVAVWEERQAGERSIDKREYQQLILLWNVMQVVSRSNDLVVMSSSVCRHMVEELGLEVVSLLSHQGQGIAAVAGASSLTGELGTIADLGLSESEFHLVEAFFTDYAGDAQYRETYLFHVSNQFVLFLRAGHEIGPQEVRFLRALASYFATGIARISGSQQVAVREPSSQTTPLIHGSAQMDSILDSARLVAPTDATVLISGESGTGKELLARYIHDLSPRKDMPFTIVDCAAVVDSLFESELFGHEQGAFTGADHRAPGRLREAAGGTVMLDEIGKLPLAVQAKLLRFVQAREVSPVGSSSYEFVDTRVIAATNRDLKEMAGAGQFREDLYHRLNVFTIHTPALRERPDDVLMLARYYLAYYAGQYGRGTMEFSAEAERALLEYHWPGNVRELMNIINRSVIVSKENRVNNIHLGLFSSVAEPTVNVAGDRVLRDHLHQLVEVCLDYRPELPPMGQWLEEDLIHNRFTASAGVYSQAASSLSIPESTLRRKVIKMRDVYGLAAPDRPESWLDASAIIDELMRLATDKGTSVLDLAMGLLVEEFERRQLTRQDGARLLGVSLPTYRRYLD